MNEINVESQSGEVEHEWKELLYTLFYEIKSEILGHKIEIEEEEYQENVRTITIPKLVKYIHDENCPIYKFIEAQEEDDDYDEYDDYDDYEEYYDIKSWEDDFKEDFDVENWVDDFEEDEERGEE